MYSFVLTLASISWMLLSFLSLILISFTVNNARWILGNVAHNDSSGLMYESLGIDTRCSFIKNVGFQCSELAIDGLGADPKVFPTLWKISFIFFTIGLYMTVLTTIAAFSSCYVHTLFNKSIFNIAGCIQALAGLFFINAFIFYMGGWGNGRVLSLCGENAGPFTLGNCSLGITFYYAILGVLVTFIAACMSSAADKSVFRYKVTRRMNAGKRFIFVL